MHLGGRRIDGGQNPVQHLIGDPEILLRLEGGQRIQIPRSKHFIRQLISDRRIHPKEITQGVAILHLGQAADHKRTGILRAEKFDLANPVEELLPLLLRRLPVRLFRRHVMGLHVRLRLLPVLAGGRAPGVLERGLVVEAPLRFLIPMTLRAVGVHEGGDPLMKGLFGLGLLRRELPVVARLRMARHGQGQRHAQERHGHQATGWSFRGCHSVFIFDQALKRTDLFRLSDFPRGRTGRHLAGAAFQILISSNHPL